VTRPAKPLFNVGAWKCVELAPDAMASLQAFFEDNPDYHIAVEGRPPGPQAARAEFESLPPAGWRYGKRWMLGFILQDQTMEGMACLISDLFVEGVWHLGLFIVATPLHGKGTAHELYGGLEFWMRANGARWLRLGVVDGNRRAERFWERQGYVELRRRLGVRMGERSNDVRVMAKPLGSGTLSEYLALVARDRPESP
jgi:GNAT superfamily N-acetyltransferase